MLATIILTIISFVGLIIGFSQWINFENLNRQRVFGILLGVVFTIIISGLLFVNEIITRYIAEFITINLYALFAGFFLGSAVELLIFVRRAGPVDYIQQSMFVQYIPNLLALCIILYGLYKTHLFIHSPSTLLSWSSGLSLVSFGIYGWRLRLIPEFRAHGILILDRYIPWHQIISYEWYTEDAIRIDYQRTPSHISEIKTSVPPKDQLNLERLLRRKMEQFGHPQDYEYTEET